MLATFCSRLLSALVLLGAILTSGQARAQPALSLQDIMQNAYDATKTAETAEDYTQIIDLCARGYEKNPNEKAVAYLNHLSAWALNRRGKAYSQQAGDAVSDERAAELEALALADFEEALRRDPKKWHALHNRGVSYALAGELDKAMADFNRTIEINPKYANAWFNRGEIYFERGKFAEAISDYSRAIQLDRQAQSNTTRVITEDDEVTAEKVAATYNARAHAYFQLKQYQKALSDFTQAVSLAPENARLLTDRADMHADLGKWSEAAADYRAAVKLDSKFARAFMGAAWVMATCPDERFRNPKLAIESAATAINLAGQNQSRYLDTLAAAYAAAGRYDEAQETIDRAIASAQGEAVKELQSRKKLYAAGRPYRDTPLVAANSLP